MRLKENAIHQGCRLIIHLAGDVISDKLLWLLKTFIFCYKLQRREESRWEVSFRWASSERSRKLQTESAKKGCWCELSFTFSFLPANKKPLCNYQRGDIRVWLSLLCRFHCPVLENKWKSGERTGSDSDACQISTRWWPSA